MFSRRRFTLGGCLLGGCLLIVLFFLIIGVAALLSSTNLLSHGVTTQGVITNQGTVGCGRSGTKLEFWVQFTDQTGQVHTSTISQCDYSGFNASPGDSVAIVYLPDDPTTIAPPDGLMGNVQVGLGTTIFLGIITLILLPLWIRKRILQSSQQPLSTNRAKNNDDDWKL